MGAAHCPTNVASFNLPKHFNENDNAIVDIAVIKNTSEGIFCLLLDGFGKQIFFRCGIFHFDYY